MFEGAMVRSFLIVAVWCFSGMAVAADLSYSPISRGCFVSSDSQILKLKRPELTSTLQRYRDEAVAAATNLNVVGSKAPAFDWAVAAIVQCNAALGYLDGGHVDKVSSQKCDCLHDHIMSPL
jgi:hypothetical protein